MKKRILCRWASVFMAVSLIPMTAFAGTWENASSGYRYQKDDGAYAISEWAP